MIDNSKKNAFLDELQKLHKRNELSSMVSPDYFEPGMMEYLDEFEGTYDCETDKIVMRFEVKGTRYEGRTEQIEKVNVGDPVQIVRDETNIYNSNNFAVLTIKGNSLGNMPAELCNVMAPLYDNNELVFEKAVVSFVEPISKRSRYAKQAVLFVELKCRFR